MGVGIIASSVRAGGLTALYSDDFNRANGAPGSNWGEAAAGSYLVASNQLARQAGGSDMADWIGGAMANADHWVEADIAGAGAGGVYVVIHARSSGSGYGQNCYMGFLIPGGSGIEIGKNVGFSYSTVANNSGYSHIGSGKLRLEVQGSAQRLYVNNVLAISAADTSITTGTSVGINCNGPPGTYDNFRAGNL